MALDPPAEAELPLIVRPPAPLAPPAAVEPPAGWCFLPCILLPRGPTNEAYRPWRLTPSDCDTATSYPSAAVSAAAAPPRS